MLGVTLARRFKVSLGFCGQPTAITHRQHGNVGKKEAKEGIWKIFRLCRLEISKRDMDPEDSERPVQHVVSSAARHCKFPGPGHCWCHRPPCLMAAAIVGSAFAGLFVDIQQASHQRSLLHQSNVFGRSRRICVCWCALIYETMKTMVSEQWLWCPAVTL